MQCCRSLNIESGPAPSAEPTCGFGAHPTATLHGLFHTFQTIIGLNPLRSIPHEELSLNHIHCVMSAFSSPSEADQRMTKSKRMHHEWQVLQGPRAFVPSVNPFSTLSSEIFRKEWIDQFIASIVFPQDTLSQQTPYPVVDILLRIIQLNVRGGALF